MDLYKDERDLVYRPFSTSSRSSVRMFEEMGMGTVEDHYLAETHTVILNRLIFCSYA